MPLTTDDYWDCECDRNYIHAKNLHRCPRCFAIPEDQPDSIIDEVRMAHIIDDQERLLTYADLKRINDSSVKAGRNRNLYFDQLPIHDDGTVYPIAMSFMHNDIEIRTTIIFNEHGLTGILDMSFDEYAQLTTQKKFKEDSNA